ncbi:MAG: cohesin domain-containing protein, partial [Acidobacteria bacterium]|nr:cohesin domain-containing protein [Acidobacteriota bacterium]
TPDGMAAFPGLANADLTGTVRWVNYFVGDLGNLKVLATASQGANTRQVILGGARTPSPCPEITSFNPTSGSAGTNVTITGRGFTGVNSVKFANNVTATFTVNSDTQITATVPGGAVTGPITISKPNCADVQTGMFTIGPCIAVSIPPNLTGSPNGALTVPINVSDTTGRNALSYDAVLTFDSSVLRLQNPPFDRSGTLSANMTVTTNSPTAGRLNISGFGSNALTGAGALLNLKFDVIGSPNACSDLNWTSFRFNEGTPCSTTSNGRVCVTPDGGSIAGMVNYCAANPPKPVPGATITAAGAPQRSATTDGSGRYQLPNLGAGPYTVTPAKTGDANGITSFDAAQIAQHVVQIITLNPCQQAAADTSGNGEITSFDAAFIAQYVVGITNPDNKTGTWKFLPPTRSYASVNGNQTGQNFDAVLMGELTGNWTPGGGNTLLASQSLTNKPALSPTQVAISLPQVPAATGSSITIPITVGDLTGRNFISFDFDLTYDAAVLQAQPQPTDATDTLSRNLTITANATPGRLRVSGFGAQAMAGAGTLIKLKFTVAGAAGTGTALAWQRFLFNETPQTSLVNGRVNAALAVTSVSAASFKPESAAESIVAAFGASLATTTTTASALPLPTSLAGTTVKVKDSAGVERLAPLFFVAPTQVNYLAPPEAAPGAATVAITSGNGTVSVGTINIATVAPGLFAANADGQGVGAMVVARVRPDGSQVFESAVRFDPAQNKFVAAPIDLGAENEQVVLLIFGTGFRHRSAPSVVSVSIGGVNAQVDYAGPQPDFAGLDQLNARLPRSLAGRGEVDIVVTVDGKTANTIKIFVK